MDIHQTEILRYLRRLMGNPTTAEDLFQDTFLLAFCGFARLRPGSNHRAWLYRIATNLFLNHRRAGGRRAEVGLIPELPSKEASPSTAHDGAAALADLRKAVGRCCLVDSGRRSFSGSCTVSATVRSVLCSGVTRRRRGLMFTRPSAVCVASWTSPNGECRDM